MASLCQGTALYFNGCLPFKKVVCKYLINKDGYFCSRFFCLSMFANKATSFLATGFTGKYRPVLKGFDNACKLQELFHNGVRAIITNIACFKNSYGKFFGIII